MSFRFRNRREAGRMIAARMSAYRGRPDVLVLALPPGGVPVGQEVARELQAPFEVLGVNPSGSGGDEKCAMGGVASSVVTEVIVREVDHRWAAGRSGSAERELRGWMVILVDDGMATGATMRAAIALARAGHAARVVVAVPVVAREAYFELRGKVEEFVTLQSPKNFVATRDYYAEFPQVSDEEVCDLLAHAVR